MKKIYLILSVFAVVFTACETDFDVNATWEEVIVVYGLLDAGDGKELQQIKISKAFLGEMDALQMAQYADSINFDPNDLDVKIFRIKNNEVTDTVSLSAVTANRDEGIFNEKIIIYEFVNTDFFKSDSEYELLIENKVSGNVVSGYTELISSFDFTNSTASSKRLGLYFNGEFSSSIIKWDNATNGKIYQLDMVFEYKENEDTIKLIWSQDLMTSDGNPMSSILEGEKFFNLLNESISQDGSDREFINFNLIMTVGTTDLETYISVNQPITGIVQERPSFTNINNGLGLFSSRYTQTGSGWTLSFDTKKYLTDQFNISF
jgi:hypothetical protein